MPWNTHTRHIKHFPEIWFETEHFEILVFLGSGFHLSPLEIEMALEKNYHGFFKLGKFN